MSGRKRYIWLKGTAGMGNRMLVALTAILYAQITGRRLFVDWTDPMFSNAGENVFGRFFGNAGLGPALLSEKPPTDSVTPELWKENLDATPMQFVNKYFPEKLGKHGSTRQTSVDLSRADYPEQVVMFWGWDEQIDKLRSHFCGDLASLRGTSTFAILRQLAQRHLVLTPPIRERVDAFKREHLAGPTTIAVHVRYTDRRTPLKAFHRQVRRALDEHDGATVFLSTDSQDVERQFREHYPRVVTTPKSFPEGGGAIHMDLKHDDRTGRAVEALVDMYLLSECDYLVYARRSTFSYMSHLLSNLPDGRVIDVDRFNLTLKAKRLLQKHFS